MQVRVRAMALNRCWFQIDSEQSMSRKTPGVQYKATSLRPRINYFLKLTQPRSIPLLTRPRGHRNEIERATGQQPENQCITAKSPVAHNVSMFPTETTVSEDLSPYNTVVRILR
jgi:hypothetical protein